jgi:hypothetical protein
MEEEVTFGSQMPGFWIWDKRTRIARDGSTAIKPVRGNRLKVVGFLEHWPNGRHVGRLLYSDGTMSEEFRVDESKPSYLAKMGLCFKRWYRGCESAMRNEAGQAETASRG